MRCYINIETIPPMGTRPDPSMVKVPGNYSKPESIAKYQQEHAEEAWYALATDHLQAQIAIISILPETDTSPTILTSKNERELIFMLDDWMEAYSDKKGWSWQTWNGIGFDYPILRLRGMRHRSTRVARAFAHKRWQDETHGDLMLDFGGMRGLDKMAKSLGIHNDNPIPGSSVPRLIWGEDHHLVERHTSSRVTLLREIEKLM